MNRLPPGLFLILLAPVLGELVSAHQTLWQFINPINFLLMALPYGFGAVICRELTMRWGKGWFCLVLLGVAFGLYEEAIVARSFWDPQWSELGALGDYAFWRGGNWLFAELLIHFHLTVSILSSVVLAEIIYPERRHERWLSKRGLVLCFIGLALWLPALMLINPFVPPVPAIVISGLTILGLGVLGRQLPAQVFPPRPGKPTRPFWYGLIAAVNMTLVFVCVFMLPEQNPAWLPPWPVMALIVAGLDMLAFAVIMSWSGNGTAWDDRHKLAFVIGLLAFFVAFDFLKDIDEGFGGLTFVGLGAIWAFWSVRQRTYARYMH